MPTIRPLNDKQKAALQTSCDYAVFAGSVKGGKTFVASWFPAYRIKHKIGKSAMFLRVNDRNFKDPGGFFDKFKEIYGLKVNSDKSTTRDADIVGKVPIGTLNTTMPAIARFVNGYECYFKSVYRFDKKTLESLFKTNETDLLIVDECEDFPWSAISYAQTRLRGKIGIKRQVIMVQNPERECFVRRICGSGVNGGGWIKDDGYVNEDMNGKVRYFFNPEGNEGEFYWGDTPEEVYMKCKDRLDAMLLPSMSWRDAIKTMVFFDLPILDDDKEYLGRLLGSSAFASVADVNWNYSKFDADEAEGEVRELKPKEVSAAFKKPAIDRFAKYFMTVDVAGATEDDSNESNVTKSNRRSDNMTCMYWGLNQYGLHCIDMESWARPHITDVKDNIRRFRDKHNLMDSQMVIDMQGIGSMLVYDFPNARRSNKASKMSNIGQAKYANVKSENIGVTCLAIQQGVLTFNPDLAYKEYQHSRIVKGTNVSFQMMFESKGIIFKQLKSEKKEIIPKEEMKKHLKGFSPDIFDNVFMAVGAYIYDMYRLLSDKGATNLKPTSDDDVVLEAPRSIKEYNQRNSKSGISRFTNRLNNVLKW